ncbi:MAG: hypothetical protein JWO88_2923 [Frankiales bacterium]|nr:hypothetical protein [Frankiales bacterium]
MPPRPRRRAVGPPGARPVVDEPRDEEPGADGSDQGPLPDDDERFRAERPPHHDQER